MSILIFVFNRIVTIVNVSFAIHTSTIVVAIIIVVVLGERWSVSEGSTIAVSISVSF